MARTVMRFFVVAALALIGAVGGGGCVQRTISITSQPEGALVYLNDEEVGRTPLEVPFTFYGTYDVRLEAEGHQPLWTTAKAKAPVWEYPGPDLIAEAIPNAKSNVKWHFEMDPAAPADDAAIDRLMDHAQQMRSRVRQGE